jgi:ATP-dependent DNA ligase
MDRGLAMSVVHRTVVWREADTVRLQARSGRDVTPVWMDPALAALDMLPPGLVPDGEAVIYASGKIDFAAAQSRALSTPARARRLAEDLPAHFVAWGILLHPEHGDIRGRRYDDRRALLADLLEEYDVKPPNPAGSDDRRPGSGHDLVPTTPGAGLFTLVCRVS